MFTLYLLKKIIKKKIATAYSTNKEWKKKIQNYLSIILKTENNLKKMVLKNCSLSETYLSLSVWVGCVQTPERLIAGNESDLR